jgi:hypothetical protein
MYEAAYIPGKTFHQHPTQRHHMKRYIPIIILLIMPVLSPMNSRAASPVSDRDADQLGDIGRELSHVSLVRREPVPVKPTRQWHLHEQKRILARLQQSDLLNELLASGVVHHESTQVSDADRKLHE